MYYSHKCSYCSKVFYTYNTSREHASRALYHGIKKHLIVYNEDHKEYKFDDGHKIDSNEVYVAMFESSSVPSGGYKV